MSGGGLGDGDGGNVCGEGVGGGTGRTRGWQGWVKSGRGNREGRDVDRGRGGGRLRREEEKMEGEIADGEIVGKMNGRIPGNRKFAGG